MVVGYPWLGHRLDKTSCTPFKTDQNSKIFLLQKEEHFDHWLEVLSSKISKEERHIQGKFSESSNCLHTKAGFLYSSQFHRYVLDPINCVCVVFNPIDATHISFLFRVIILIVAKVLHKTHKFQYLLIFYVSFRSQFHFAVSENKLNCYLRLLNSSRLVNATEICLQFIQWKLLRDKTFFNSCQKFFSISSSWTRLHQHRRALSIVWLWPKSVLCKYYLQDMPLSF